MYINYRAASSNNIYPIGISKNEVENKKYLKKALLNTFKFDEISSSNLMKFIQESLINSKYNKNKTIRNKK